MTVYPQNMIKVVFPSSFVCSVDFADSYDSEVKYKEVFKTLAIQALYCKTDLREELIKTKMVKYLQKSVQRLSVSFDIIALLTLRGPLYIMMQYFTTQGNSCN